VLIRRLGLVSGSPGSPFPNNSEPLRLPLSADQRTDLRGHRRSACGRDLSCSCPAAARLVSPAILGRIATGSALVDRGGRPRSRAAGAQPRSAGPPAGRPYHPGATVTWRWELQGASCDCFRGLGASKSCCTSGGLVVERITAPFQPESGASMPAQPAIPIPIPIPTEPGARRLASCCSCVSPPCRWGRFSYSEGLSAGASPTDHQRLAICGSWLEAELDRGAIAIEGRALGPVAGGLASMGADGEA